MRIGFMNPQGNFDNKDSYWTAHPDFGGQLVYVKELALALDQLGVDVEIFTRRIEDPEWGEFREKEEIYENSGVKIIRIPFGPKGFLNKEKLWPYLREYAEGVRAYYEGQGRRPDFMTAHYGDGGLSAVYFKELTGVSFSFTAHSLGAQKMDKLKVSKSNEGDMNRIYRFSERIAAERRTMEEASLIFVSTNQERMNQYAHARYKGAVSPEDEKIKVVPPGVNLKIFNTHRENSEEARTQAELHNSLKRDLREDRFGLPIIFISGRLEKKKNHLGLVKAYGENPPLQQRGNLLIALRGVKDPYRGYQTLKDEEKAVMDSLMDGINRMDMKGKVAFVTLESQEQLAAAYRWIGNTGGLLALPSLYEPFGLAVVEAMACGLVVAATKNGGPSEILREKGEAFGFLMNPEDPGDMGKVLEKALGDQKLWQCLRKKGIQRVHQKYTWESTAKGYLKGIKEHLGEKPL